MILNITEQERKAVEKVSKNFIRNKSNEDIFYDLCFALMAPQTKFSNNLKVIQKLKEVNFYGLPYSLHEKDINQSLYINTLYTLIKPVRFYRNKTRYILEAKRKFPEILKVIRSLDVWDNKQSIHVVDIYAIREWLTTNIKGMGYKTASHFLRNIGDTSLAILDTHIIKFLNKNIGREGLFGVIYQGDWGKIIKTKKGYLLAEKIFQEIASKNNMTTFYLDAYLWHKYSGVSWNDFKF